VGHTSAASAIEDALRALEPTLSSRTVDSYRYAASIVSQVVSGGYLRMVTTIPQMYRFLYDRAERATEVGPLRALVHQFTARNLRGAMQEWRPDVVICTHAFPCGVMAEYKRQFADAPPVVGVVTDFAVHAFWMHKNVEKYAVATKEMRNALIARGVCGERVLVSGIPIDRRFGFPPSSRRLLRERLGLPAEGRVALIMGGGLGIGPLQTMMKALQSVREPLCVVAIVGRSGRSEQRVLEYAHHVGYPVRVLRFVNNVHEYMHASDLLITKPGGLTTAEALASCTPMVLFEPLPGQEERNTRYLVERGAALRAADAADLADTLQQLFDGEQKMDDIRSAMRALGRPGAALDVAQLVREVTFAREEAIA
jgi:processive 1,2-diacylglycerol beta-glucosyltransferase